MPSAKLPRPWIECTKETGGMRLRRVGLALALGCGLTAIAHAQFTQPVTIPLQLVNISASTSNPSYKLGITIGFDNNAPKIYEFDTGAAGFFAAYNTSNPAGDPSAGTVSWWDGGTPTGQTLTMTYTSGNEYQNAAIATTNLTFYPPGQTTAANGIATISNVNVARIGTALTIPGKDKKDDPDPTPVPNPNWYAALQQNPPQPPLETAFYGDFGMGLYRNQGNPIDSGITGLFAILPQFQFAGGSGVMPGFIVRTGGYPTTANPSPTPQVQVGITQADIDSFPYALPMQQGQSGASGSGIVFPYSGAATYNAAVSQSNVDLSLGTATQQATPPGIGLLTDTGAPSTAVHEGTGLTVNSNFIVEVKKKFTLASDVVFTLSNPPWAFAQIQNGQKGQGDVGIDTTTNPYTSAVGYTNTGITLFFNYNVMYDLTNGMLRLQPNQPYQVPIYRASGTQGFVIYAAMGVGGALVPYLLDTGSPQTFASYGSWWENPPPEQTTQGANLYSFAAGFGYYWTSWSTVVALGTNDGQILATTANPVNIGLITNVKATTTLTPQQTYTQWQAAYNSGGTPFSDPVANTGTFGNFGAALCGDSTFATILAQLPLAPGLKHGFIINSGGSSSLQGTVTVGLSQAAIEEFQTTPGAIILPMAALENGGIQQYLPGNVPAYQATQVTTSMVSLNGSQYTAAVPTIFDTGGGQEVVFYQNQAQGSPNPVPPSLITGGADHGLVLPGTAFSLSGENQSNAQQAFLDFTVQNTLPAQNTLDVDGDLTVGIGGVRVNTGIQIFNEYQVMFDLDDGLLGLLPISVSPPPAPAPAPPVVKVTSLKRFGTDKRSVRVRGTATSQLRIASVTYRITRGRFQKADGTTKWKFEGSLKRGMNHITIRATDSTGQATAVTRHVRFNG